MNTKKITDLLRLFDGHLIVEIVNNRTDVDTISRYTVVGNPQNEVLYLGWEIDDLEYNVKFTEHGLSDARFSGGSLLIEDLDGDEIEIKFYERVAWNRPVWFDALFVTNE
jgi:hypothetical protein